MSKDPAFLFYPNDWVGGTMGMTFEEKGAYMEVLMMQFNRGHMTEHMICQVIGQHWDTIKDKFKQDDQGMFFNERLEFEQEKRKKFSESRRNNKKGTNQHTSKSKDYTQEKDMNGHMTSHMENEIENENKDIDIDVNKNLSEKISNEISLSDQKPGRMSTDERKFHSHTLELAKVFNLNEFMHMKHMVEINKWIETVDVDYVRQQIRSYLEYKVLTGENRCGWISWIEGKWNEEDFTEKLKQFKNGRGKKTGSQVVTDEIANSELYRRL